MGLGRAKHPVTAEARFVKHVEKDNSQLMNRIKNLEEAIEFCKYKMKTNNEFLDKVKNINEESNTKDSED